MMRSGSNQCPGIHRRQFLLLSALSAGQLLAGCAVNPVTGKQQLMFVSEEKEIAIDRQFRGKQFSNDYGEVQDQQLNAYIQRTGMALGKITQRPNMPYSFRAVNAVYVNAYAFPGGSIAATRGILLNLENEAELASLLGHELGHVNARHTAEQITKSRFISGFVGLGTILAGTYNADLANSAAQLGQLGAGALLASYSRDNEREADALGLDYMTRADYGTEGFVGLMEMLNSLSKNKHGAASLLFATHPMSSERYQTAINAINNRYQQFRGQPLHRERYMDYTAGLRKMEDAIKEMQEGEKAMGQKQYDQAESLFRLALKKAPRDYAGMLLMAKCKLSKGQTKEAQRYTEEAKKIYPREAQAYHLSGFAKIQNKQYAAAFHDFSSFEKRLPGIPYTSFYKGISLEGMQRQKEAAREYYSYLKSGAKDDRARYAYKRLSQWGYLKQ